MHLVPNLENKEEGLDAQPINRLHPKHFMQRIRENTREKEK
jgi:hypothetical protein